ncbi:hypothetical protein TSAR_002710, partial [Trichomalopsis sarcophagae]
SIGEEKEKPCASAIPRGEREARRTRRANRWRRGLWDASGSDVSLLLFPFSSSQEQLVRLILAADQSRAAARSLAPHNAHSGFSPSTPTCIMHTARHSCRTVESHLRQNSDAQSVAPSRAHTRTRTE